MKSQRGNFIFGTALLLVCMVASTLGGDKKDAKKGKSVTPAASDDIELISADGEIKVETAMNILTSCGGAVDTKVVSKAMQKLMTDCGFKNKIRKKRSAENLYNLACSLTCILKKAQFVTKDGKFLADEEKIKKVIQMTKGYKDEAKLKKVTSEIALCAKLTPPYNEQNCYSAAAWAMCAVIAARRVCVA